MKTFKLAFVLFYLATMPLFVNGSNNAGKTPDPRMMRVVKAENPTTVRVILGPNTILKSKIVLKDINGQELWSERIGKDKDFAKDVNMKNLPNGDYLLSYTDASSEIIQPVTIENGDVKIDASERIYLLQPEIEVENRDVTVRLVTNTLSDISLKLFNENGQEVYTEKLDSSSGIYTKLDLNQVESGIYSLMVVTPYRTFYNYVELF